MMAVNIRFARYCLKMQSNHGGGCVKEKKGFPKNLPKDKKNYNTFISVKTLLTI